MIDLDRELRATLNERAGLAPPPVDVRAAIRVARRRQLGVVLTAVVAVAAVVVGSIAGVSALTRSSERRVPVGPVETPSVSIGPVAACPPGSTPDEPGPVDQARPSSESVPMAFDRDSGRIVLLEPRPSVTTTWTFDVCTNTWQQMAPDREPRGAKGGMGVRLAYDADSDLTVALINGKRVWAYDLESDTWTEKGRAPIHSNGSGWVRMAYDPVSGLVVVRQEQYWRRRAWVWLWTYDVDSDVWVEIHDTVAKQDQPAYQRSLPSSFEALQFVYDNSVGRFVAFQLWGDTRPWTFDLPTATWSPMQAIAPSVDVVWGGAAAAAYDEAAEMTVVSSGGFVAGYDASADRWMSLYGHPAGEGTVPPGPLNRFYAGMVYDPVNERLVVYGGAWGRRDDVWAFDVATGELTRLLAPSGPST